MYLKDPGLPGVFSAAAQALPPAVFGLLRRPQAVAGQATVSSSALPVSASACVCAWPVGGLWPVVGLTVLCPPALEGGAASLWLAGPGPAPCWGAAGCPVPRPPWTSRAVRKWGLQAGLV